MNVIVILFHFCAASAVAYALYLLIKGDKPPPVTQTLIQAGPGDKDTSYQLMGDAKLHTDEFQLVSNLQNQCGSIQWNLQPGASWTLEFMHRINVSQGQDAGEVLFIGVYRPVIETGCKYAPGRNQPVSDSSGYQMGFDIANKRVDLYYNGNVVKSSACGYVYNSPQTIGVTCANGVIKVFYAASLVLSYTDSRFSERSEIHSKDTCIEIGAWTDSKAAEQSISQIWMQYQA